MVVILPMGDQASFTGTTQNGVSTSNWGSYGTSFDVVRAQVQTASAQLKPQFSDAELAAAGACPGTLPIDQTSLLCACPADPAVRSVWGSGPYTADSDICSAALHAGAMGAGGGMVFTIATAGQDSYSGTSANGVTTRDWRAYGRSIAVSSATGDSTGGPSLSVLEDCSTLPTGLDVYSCFCPANDGRLRSVWGSGPYTSDSDICTAALHDGAINLQGGDVTVLRIGGLNAYAASESNGASTSAWADYTSSIVFDRN